MYKFMLDIPNRIETERLYLRPYQAGDGKMYYAASRRNRKHLERYEFGNVLYQLKDEQHAEDTVRALSAAWVARNSFFMGVFERVSETGWDKFTWGHKTGICPNLRLAMLLM